MYVHVKKEGISAFVGETDTNINGVEKFKTRGFFALKLYINKCEVS